MKCLNLGSRGPDDMDRSGRIGANYRNAEQARSHISYAFGIIFIGFTKINPI